MNVRRRFIKASATHTPATSAMDATNSHRPQPTSASMDTSICRQGDDGSTGTTGPHKEPTIVDFSGSVDGTGARLGAGSDSGGGGGGSGGGSGGGGGNGGYPEKKELRHELRVQMNIERKRARLFEDIQTLPYR